MPVLNPPLPSAQRRLLRAAVLELAVSDHRRRVPPVLHVGVPGGVVASVADEQPWDHGLRTEIVGAMLRAGGEHAWTWLTRSGPLSLQDVDVAWQNAAVSAAAERGVDVTYVVVTRHGWTDPRSGAGHTWKRIRRRPPH